jgi:hypothetical protein
MQTQGAFKLEELTASCPAASSSIVTGVEEANYASWSAREILLGLRNDTSQTDPNRPEMESNGCMSRDANFLKNIAMYSRAVHVS